MSCTTRILRTLTLICLLLALNACSFSHSSESSSDSSGSVSDLASSPSSLLSSGGSKKYEADVVDYTYAYLKSSSAPSDYAEFQKGLTDIAEKRGVSDWESNEHTYLAIGKALKKAQFEGVGYETFKKNFSNNDAEKMSWIEKGYNSQK